MSTGCGSWATRKTQDTRHDRLLFQLVVHPGSYVNILISISSYIHKPSIFSPRQTSVFHGNFYVWWESFHRVGNWMASYVRLRSTCHSPRTHSFLSVREFLMRNAIRWCKIKFRSQLRKGNVKLFCALAELGVSNVRTGGKSKTRT